MITANNKAVRDYNPEEYQHEEVPRKSDVHDFKIKIRKILATRGQVCNRNELQNIFQQLLEKVLSTIQHV